MKMQIVLATGAILFIAMGIWLATIIAAQPPPSETVTFRFAVPHCRLLDHRWAAECELRKLKKD